MWNELAVAIALLVGSLLAIIFLRIGSASTPESSTRLVLCSTSHTRLFPIRHSFRYSLLYVFLSLDKPQSNAFFAIDKWRIFYIRSSDYLGSPPCSQSILEKLKWHLQDHVHSKYNNLI